MEVGGDELAGVIDPFGGLTREELLTALEETWFRAGEAFDAEAAAEAVERARESYHLVGYDDGDRRLLVSGPAAFPDPPPAAEDLPHILDVERRSVDRERLGGAVRERLRTETDAAAEDGDDERLRRLLDVSYDVEAWAPVDASDTRERIDAVLDGR
jgi:hypothetical protein